MLLLLILICFYLFELANKSKLEKLHQVKTESFESLEPNFELNSCFVSFFISIIPLLSLSLSLKTIC